MEKKFGTSLQIGTFILSLVLFSGCNLNNLIFSDFGSDDNGDPDSPTGSATTISIDLESNLNIVYKGSTITPSTPTVNGEVVSFSVSPSLPPGLNLDTATGEISGTPTAISTQSTYSLQATTDTGVISTSFDLIVGLEFTVVSIDDNTDANLGDEICDAGINPCTLRAAIDEAESLGAALEAVKIHVPAGTYSPTSTYDATYPKYTDIVGAGNAVTVIDGTSSGAIFLLNGSISRFNVSGLTFDNSSGVAMGLAINDNSASVENMNVYGCTFEDNNAGAGMGAAIGLSNTQTLNIDSTFFYRNTASRGGAISFENLGGSLTITNSIFNNNDSTSGTYGGGAIYLYGVDVNISESIFTNNTAAAYGGAIYNPVARNFTLSESGFGGNVANLIGGAVRVSDDYQTIIRNNTFETNMSTRSGGIDITDSANALVEGNTFKDNAASADSGGGMTFGIQSFGGSEYIIRNNTFYSNSADHGGGLAVETDSPSLKIQIYFNTFAQNTGSTAADSFQAGDGAVHDLTIELLGNIFADGTDNNECALGSGGASITSLGYNLSEDASCSLSGPGDLPSTESDLVVGAPVDNGGSTYTILLQPGSAAENTGGSCMSVPTDQRGVVRPSSGCDMGAVEIP